MLPRLFIFASFAVAAIAAILFFRPDIRIAATHLIDQKYHQSMPAANLGSLTTDDLLHQVDVLLHQVGVGKLVSLPWMEYYNHARDLIEGLVSWAAFAQGALTVAGHAELGRWARTGIYIGASVFVLTVLRIVWAVVARFLSIIWTVLAWIFYPLRFVFRFLYRLLFGRNGRTPIGSGPSTVGHGAPGHTNAAGAGGR